MGDVWGGMKVYYFGQVSFIIEGRYVFLGQHCTATVVPSYMYSGTFKKIKDKFSATKKKCPSRDSNWRSSVW